MRVIVVGGGVAGAASALALRKVGAEVTVYEAHADPAGPVGSFVSLAANGLRGLAELGVLEPVRSAGFAVPRQRMWSGSGRLLGDVPRGRLSGDPMHGVTLPRGRLVEELRAGAVAAGARIVTGERLVDASVTATGVRAVFAGGRTAEADVLVGADGIWSATRRILDPSVPDPAYAGLYTAAGVARGVAGVEPGTFNMVFGRSGAFVAIGVPDGSVWWAAQPAAPAAPDPAAITLDHLKGLYRGEPMPTAVLDAVTERHRPTLHHVLPPVRVWRDDRIVLVGDASHPVGAGQGASMAIEDATVLAHALATAGPVPAALASYEENRRDRTARLVRMAAANRDAKVAGPVARRVRAAVMPLAFRFLYEKGTAWLYDHTLPELTPARGQSFQAAT